MTGAVDTVKDTLNNFLEAIAVMIVTTCVIPIVTMLFFIWASKSILGVNINLPEKEQLMLVKKGIQKIKQKKLNEMVKAAVEKTLLLLIFYITGKYSAFSCNIKNPSGRDRRRRILQIRILSYRLWFWGKDK